MATAQLNLNQQPQPPIVAAKAQIIPVKIGFMGDQGVGKTTTAGLLAAAISAQFHDRAPIFATDPELGWQFLNPVIFQKEKIKLIQGTVPTFAGMLADMKRAEREGAAVWAVELGKIWIEIIRTLQRKDKLNWGMQLRSMWDDFVAQFLSTRMHCMVLGRIQDVIEEILTEDGDVRSVKVGEGMKAGGQKNNFGYEPHLVIRLYREIKPRVRKGKTFEEEGRTIHRALVTKDRTWALNGKVFRWPDRDTYKPGDFKFVWKDLEPHFRAVQATNAFLTLDQEATSVELVEDGDVGQYFARRERKNAISAEIKACLDLYFAGRGKEDIQIRLAVSDLIFGVKSKEAAETLSLEALERGLRILQAYEKLPQHKLDSKENVLEQIAQAVESYDRGECLDDIPF